MRISDWSSDVCSSDLVGEGDGANLGAVAPHRKETLDLKLFERDMHAAGFSHSLTLISVCLFRPVYPSRIACPAGRSGGVFLRPVRLAVADLAAQPSDDAEDEIGRAHV